MGYNNNYKIQKWKVNTKYIETGNLTKIISVHAKTISFRIRGFKREFLAIFDTNQILKYIFRFVFFLSRITSLNKTCVTSKQGILIQVIKSYTLIEVGSPAAHCQLGQW